MIKSEVYCAVDIEGIHNWENCPHKEVAYLKDPHRHLFKIKCYIDVEHNDRDVEFIIMKHQISDYFKKNYWDEFRKIHIFGSMSCEMIAAELIEEFDLSKCEVSEDGENGAILTVVDDE